MKTFFIRAAIGLAVVILGAGYVVRAQTPKPEILLEIEISKSGSVVGKPVIRLADGAAGSFRLADGTEVRVTPKLVSH
jgi:hypothetical protein